MAALEVLALDEATPQIRAPASGDTYAAPRAIALTPETLTGSAATSSLSIAQTWNTTGTPTAFDVNVTDTASNAASRLLNLRVGGTSLFRVDKNGAFGSETGPSVILSFGSARFGLGASGASVFQLRSDGFIAWSATTAIGGASDTILARDAANTLALRNGVNAQAFRWYQSFTDSSNYTRGQVSAASDIVTLSGESAGTGAANIDVAITPKGTGRVRYGTHAAVTTETVTGFIEIKDAGGTVRKLAVVS